MTKLHWHRHGVTAMAVPSVGVGVVASFGDVVCCWWCCCSTQQLRKHRPGQHYCRCGAQAALLVQLVLF